MRGMGAMNENHIPLMSGETAFRDGISRVLTLLIESQVRKHSVGRNGLQVLTGKPFKIELSFAPDGQFKDVLAVRICD